MDSSYHQAGGSGTLGLAWSNEAPAIRQDMIEGRRGASIPYLFLISWTVDFQFLLITLLCLHHFDLNF